MRYRSLFANNHAIMLLIDPDTGDVVDANPAACTFYGWPHAKLIQKKISDLNTLGLEQVRAEMAAAAAEQRTHFIFKHRLADGSIRDVETYSGPIRLAGRRLLYSIIHDITARVQAEAALQESEAKFRLTFDASPDAVNLNRLEDGLFVDINKGFARLTGFTREEVIGKTSLEVGIWHDPGDRQELVRGLNENGYYENLEAQFRRKDGSVATGLMSARLISLNNAPHIISITRDISEQIQLRARQQKLEDQLHQAQRLESVGRLAGGVAHDFNNLLSIIMGYSELILEQEKSNEQRSEALRQIHDAAIRARDLTRQLLAFSRKQILEMKPVDVNAVVKGFERLLGRVLGEDIAMEFKLAPGPLTVKADTAQMEQILMNLAVNARDAMISGGTLTIETACVRLDDAYAEGKLGVTPGAYALLSVSDNGAGMDKQTQALIFEPFFTTKSKDKGTGLGLATTYGIVKQHGGNIWVYSEPGQGTTFKIYLPLLSETVPDPARRMPGRDFTAGSATVLIVEDDASVRRMAVSILRRGGHKVIESGSVEDAVKQSLKYSDPIHLVLADVVMPGMRGPEVYARIAERHREAKVLYMSGYTENVIARQGVLKQGIQFIQKPFTVEGLLAKVGEVLGS